jgi:hypothetical protein
MIQENSLFFNMLLILGFLRNPILRILKKKHFLLKPNYVDLACG